MVSFNNTLKKFNTVFTRATSGNRMSGTQAAFCSGGTRCSLRMSKAQQSH